MSLKSFAKKKTTAKATPSKRREPARSSSLVATKVKPAATDGVNDFKSLTTRAHAVDESPPAADDMPLGPRGGKPAGLRPDRAVKLSVKVSHAQYRAIRMRAAEQSSNTQDILLAALAKLFEDDGLPFA